MVPKRTADDDASLFNAASTPSRGNSLSDVSELTVGKQDMEGGGLNALPAGRMEALPLRERSALQAPAGPRARACVLAEPSEGVEFDVVFAAFISCSVSKLVYVYEEGTSPPKGKKKEKQMSLGVCRTNSKARLAACLN